MSDKKNKTLKPGWRRVKFGEVVRLSKARSQDPLADGIERYVGLEHLDSESLTIRRWGSPRWQSRSNRPRAPLLCRAAHSESSIRGDWPGC